MIGITSYGAYVPYNRLNRSCIAQAFGKPAVPGYKSVASYDEDSVTMAAMAAQDCCSHCDASELNGLYLASTTLPYREKQCATIVAGAADIRQPIRSADFASSLRCGSAAMLSALDAASNGESMLVAIADRRMACADGISEMLFGDGAASFAIGRHNVIAEVLGRFSVSRDFHDQWRGEVDSFVRSWEERFALTQHYYDTVLSAARGVLAQTGLAAHQFASLIINGHTRRSRQEIAAMLGFQEKQLGDLLADEIGHTGAAFSPMMLCAALDRAKPGDYILYLSYGEGCDALVFRATAALDGYPAKLSAWIDRRRTDMNYEKYLRWRGLLTTEPQRRPPLRRTSLPEYYRNYAKNAALYGTQCTKCGTPQFPGARICIECHSIDQSVPYRFTGRQASIVTYTIDHISASEDPPNMIAVIDFAGGGRMFCNLTDCVPEEIKIGLDVQLVFRRLHVLDGINTYFWKAVLKRAEGGQIDGSRQH